VPCPAAAWSANPNDSARSGARLGNQSEPLSGAIDATLVARSTDGLRDLAGTLADTGAQINTIAADASDPDGLGARMRELYLGNGAPGVIVYNAVMGAPDRLLSSTVAHLQAAYSERIAERYWEVVHVDGPWQAEFRFTGE
jgi:hypothetical protein